MTIYTLVMARWGDEENHSYVTGNYSKLEDAVMDGVVAEKFRGDKYSFVIYYSKLDGNELRKLPREVCVDRAIQIYPHKFDSNKHYIEDL